MRFVNREKEINFFREHFASEPNSVLFLYGPKSSGKSTFLEKIARETDEKKYAVDFLDLRQVIIHNFQTFLDVFFPKKLRNKIADILDGITFNMGFFGVKIEDESTLKENAFAIMVEKLESANKRGVRPIIIIDEIHLLKNIYINGERYLIDQLFNLFIALTKVKHLAHVVLCTSDSYFIEEVYHSAKFEKAATYYPMNYFDKKEIVKWLESEGFAKKEIEIIWHYIGGSLWEIQEIAKKKKQGESIEKSCLEIIDEKYGKTTLFRFSLENEETRNEFDKIIDAIARNGYYIRSDNENIQSVNELLPRCVELDIWFYITKENKITANSESFRHAFAGIKGNNA